MSAVFKPGTSHEAYFEPMTHAHLQAVTQLEQSAYPFPWTSGNFSDSLNSGYHMQLLMGGQAAPGLMGAQPEPGLMGAQPEPGLMDGQPEPGLTGSLPGAPVLLGYFVAMKGVDETHLLNITVAPAYQKQGWGHLLLDALALWSRGLGAQWLWLEVRPSNVHAKSVYLRYGFREVGVRKGYYPDGGSGLLGAARREDALVMSLALNSMNPLNSSPSLSSLFSGAKP